ncbi:hypothetical protein NRB16_02000 [Pseudomonas sp. LJDD11]|uniref:hypothetical protein n=1 Tax=Pseudomonas sp. LJDD11 TaxID=2931984 RepID=UPI00211CE869|nr:hypothetical protein [Pseudomonas sp. LJDD11]MCQ9422301.1 hypothetical protein [Pseudomonas sp. LJDD11]
MIINISDIWCDAAARHSRFLTAEIDEGVKNLGNCYVDRLVSSFIEDNREVIINGSPIELPKCIDDYRKRFGYGLLHACASERIKIIFDFSDFSKKSNKLWTAYHLCSQARYKVCSYCHMISTGTSLPDEDTKGYRPPIDHYYTKSDYPFLALSLANFIPCCEKCNGSQMKHDLDFSKFPHLNPLTDSESIEFELHPILAPEENFAEATALLLPAEKYHLIIHARMNKPASNASIETFQLKSRYKEYSTQAYYLARKMKNLASRQQMFSAALEIPITLEDELEFKPQNYKKVPYGKARICIAKQYGALPNQL